MHPHCCHTLWGGRGHGHWLSQGEEEGMANPLEKDTLLAPRVLSPTQREPRGHISPSVGCPKQAGWGNRSDGPGSGTGSFLWQPPSTGRSLTFSPFHSILIPNNWCEGGGRASVRFYQGEGCMSNMVIG